MTFARFALTTALVSSLAWLTACRTPSTEARLKPLFNGRDWTGWDLRGQAKYSIRDGTIVGETGQGGHGWLCTDRTYGDFILELEVKIDSGNAGIQIRSGFNAKNDMVGYQIEVDPSKRAWSGGLYEQGGRAWLQPLTNNPAAQQAFKVGEWNRYRIEAVGTRIRSWVNGVPAADYYDGQKLEGLIALQVHSGKDVHVEYRNLRLADLGRHEWRPLLDGQTLQGWRPSGKGTWTYDQGALVGRHSATETDYGHLLSERSYGDFSARVTFKSVKGNSGFYFRTEAGGASGVSGFQAEIDPAKDVGGLYETNGRQWVSQPTEEQLKKSFKPGQWNTLVVHAYGGRVETEVNGQKIARLENDPGRREGKFALQVHGGQDCEVWFRSVEILAPVR